MGAAQEMGTTELKERQGRALHVTFAYMPLESVKRSVRSNWSIRSDGSSEPGQQRALQISNTFFSG